MGIEFFQTLFPAHRFCFALPGTLEIGAQRQNNKCNSNGIVNSFRLPNIENSFFQLREEAVRVLCYALKFNFPVWVTCVCVLGKIDRPMVSSACRKLPDEMVCVARFANTCSDAGVSFFFLVFGGGI